jgi:hypothetical protein
MPELAANEALQGIIADFHDPAKFQGIAIPYV